MPNRDPRVDAYIAKAAPFAQPVLQHLRNLVHTACPEVTETIKWGMPFFDYKGPFCNIAAFKAHCAFGFWKTALIPDPKGILKRDAMGSLGRITSLKDLPSDTILKGFIKAAKKLNDEGVKISPPKKTTEKKEIPVPDDIIGALKKNKKAWSAFEAFPPSHRKEYIQWITEAKTEETRQKRMATAIEWISEGKARNWKYQR
jgi:uncharacterized protein YdeI (YjbR/CyaY-like superfamily)